MSISHLGLFLFWESAIPPGWSDHLRTIVTLNLKVQLYILINPVYKEKRWVFLPVPFLQHEKPRLNSSIRTSEEVNRPELSDNNTLKYWPLTPKHLKGNGKILNKRRRKVSYFMHWESKILSNGMKVFSFLPYFSTRVVFRVLI